MNRAEIRIERQVKFDGVGIELWQRDFARVLFASWFQWIGDRALCDRRSIWSNRFRNATRRTRRCDTNSHELWMSASPGHCRRPRFKKTIDNQRTLLSRGSTAGARCGAFHHARTAIHGYTVSIGKNDMAAVRNPFWIDGDMSGVQPRAIGTRAHLTFARPVDSDAREDRLFTRKKRRAAQEKNSKSCC